MPRVVKGAGGGKRHPLNMRTTKELRERLEAAAAASGRSLAQEVEARLQRSFDQDQRLQDAFGSVKLFNLMRSIAATMEAAGLLANFDAGGAAQSSRDWLGHPYAYDQAIRRAVQILEAGRPPGEIERPQLELPSNQDRLAMIAVLGGREMADKYTKELERKLERIAGRFERMIQTPWRGADR